MTEHREPFYILFSRALEPLDERRWPQVSMLFMFMPMTSTTSAMLDRPLTISLHYRVPHFLPRRASSAGLYVRIAMPSLSVHREYG